MSSPWIYSSILSILSTQSISSFSNTLSSSNSSSSFITTSNRTSTSSSSLSSSSTISTNQQQIYTSKRRSKICQVIKVFLSEGILIVNDKKHFISILLTKQCLDNFHLSNNGQNISILQNTIIKLENWHVSTIIQCLGHRKYSELSVLGITLPFTLQCSNISCLGAYDCQTIDTPIDINKVPQSSFFLLYFI